MATTITANGINFPDGSAGTPSIGGSDTNTGLFTGSDIIGFATGGSERLKIDASGNVSIANDTGKFRLGASNDLQIYHNGSHSYLEESGTGNLYIRSSNTRMQSSAGEDQILMAENGAVEIFYDGSKRFETSSSGATITGSLTTGGFTSTTAGDALFTGTTSGRNAKWDTSHNRLIFDDNALAVFGSGADLQIYHDGNHSYIYDAGTGNLKIRSSRVDILNPAGDEDMIVAVANGQVELHYDNSKKFETTSYGNHFNGNLRCDDNSYIQVGSSQDLQIYHNGTDSVIDNGTNNLEIVTQNSMLFKIADAELAIVCNKHGAVDLYHDNTQVFATQTNGIKLHNGGASYLYFYDVNTSTIAMYTNSVNLRWYDDVNNDNIMQLSQNGDLNIDGSYSNSGVDYAEYFESTDGTAIAVGTTVVLEDGKVRAATSSETPIGVIRPKTSGTSVTGGVNQLNWQGKYLVDDYDGQVMESAVHCTWIDDNEVNQQCWKDKPPTGVTIPSDAVETTRERPKLNPLFDESKTYVPRSERNEWNCVGLLGQIPITKGQPTSSSWIKMKDKNSTVELWMVK